MDLRDFSEIGQQIENTVKNAIDSMNFDQLNQIFIKPLMMLSAAAKEVPMTRRMILNIDIIMTGIIIGRDIHSIIVRKIHTSRQNQPAGRLPADEPPADKRLPIYPKPADTYL